VVMVSEDCGCWRLWLVNCGVVADNGWSLHGGRSGFFSVVRSYWRWFE